MPIDKTEFTNAISSSQIEDDIMAFLNERKEKAYTSQEIMGGIRLQTNFSTLDTTRISTFAAADFSTLLSELVRKGKITIKMVENQMYYAAAENIAKCPKCGTEVAEPAKTWNMTGRPDKRGQSLQLQIGLFKCPQHGSFKTILNKQKL